MSGSSIALPDGIVIFWSASWLCTLSVTKLLAQVSKPPATRRTVATMKPAAVRRVSRVLRRMVLISRCTGFAAPDLVALVGHLQHRGDAHGAIRTIVLTVMWRPSLRRSRS